ncbi:MAG: hypothetical protein KKD00_05900 [Gammaproteobacteria bacterium]|nr:hypothetical protein [Gammaproteobacteria bacterium]
MTGITSFENAAHVLDELIACHEHLAELYERLQATTTPLGVMFLEQLSLREKKLADTLERYEDNAPVKVLKTWIQIPFPKDPDSFLASLESDLPEQLTTQDIYELASKADDFVSHLLEHLRDRCEIADVKKLFEDLIKGENIEHIALSKTYNSLREM